MDVVQYTDLRGRYGLTEAEVDDLLPWLNAKLRRVMGASLAHPSEDLLVEARGIALRAVERLSETEEWVTSRTEGPRSITFRHLDGILFTAAEVAELRALGGSAPTGLPVGVFPASRLERLFRGSS